MTLVQVVAGKHRVVRRPQCLGELGLALEVDPKRVGAELGEGEHLSGDLEHRGLGAERKRLLGSGKREAAVAKLGGVHPPNVAWSNVKSPPLPTHMGRKRLLAARRAPRLVLRT